MLRRPPNDPSQPSSSPSPLPSSPSSSPSPLSSSSQSDVADAAPADVMPVPRRTKLGMILRLTGFALCLTFVAGLVAAFALSSYYGQDLPVFSSIDDYHKGVYQPKLVTRIYSVDGQLIGEFANERRILVPYEKIPPKLIQAFIAAEDKKFFKHDGIDYLGIANAVLQKVTGQRERLRGASTITQQLAKSFLGAGEEGYEKATERSLRRKVREALLARQLENNLTKEEILYLYLNQIYLGHGAYGVAAAAENYFHKTVDELNVAEMSVLAGLPQAPSRYSPFINPKSARERQQYVLNRMKADGYITEKEAQDALAQSVEKTVHPRDDQFLDTAPYFTEHVRRYLYDKYGEKMLYEGGLEVHTTLNLERQHHAENALTLGVHDIARNQGFVGPVAHIEDANQWPKVLDWMDREHVKGKPLPMNLQVPGLVTEVSKEKQWVEVRVGKDIRGIVPLAGMRWARTLGPCYNDKDTMCSKGNTENSPIRNINEAGIKKGDILLLAHCPKEPMQQFLASKKAPKDAATKEAISKKEIVWCFEDLRSNDMREMINLYSKVPEGTQLFALEQSQLVQGSLVSLNPHTGYVEAMIGGYAFEQSQFNRAFQSCRQPGSSFKPIVYATAIKYMRLCPDSIVQDLPVILPPDPTTGKMWQPQNSDGTYRGEISVREAVSASRNAPAVNVLEKIINDKKEGLGWNGFRKFAQELGIRTRLKDELGTALGSSCVTPWELTNVYATWARHGEQSEPIFIKRILDRYGNTLEKSGSWEDHAAFNDPWQSPDKRLDSFYRTLIQHPKRVMSEGQAFMLHSLLRGVTQYGTAYQANRLDTLGHPTAGKTGTTNDNYDAWFVGYTPTLVTGVWVGYDQYDHRLGSWEMGGKTALPIWVEYMENALRGKKETDWKWDSRKGAAEVMCRDIRLTPTHTEKRIDDEKSGAI